MSVLPVFFINLLSGGKRFSGEWMLLLLIHIVVQNKNKKSWQKINDKSSI
jgi:hypothetical protein